MPKSKMAAPTTASLEALQGTEQRKIMDLVDNLRRAGLSSILKLPQLVVCGDQSSGKSSVLEAITEIPFPRKENLCTRFATEISMRRDARSSIRCKINPDQARPQEEKDTLAKYERTIADFEELPSLIEEATTLMGLDNAFGVVKAFSRDVLSIEICGPACPQLTLVDLPGLIHSENKSQSKQDVQLIKGLVQDYIKNERTIILAVVTAKNDYANQIILNQARAVDPQGTRTLGIITKPDFLTDGSENQQSWIDLALNKDIKFKLGWHILRNRKDEEKAVSFAERNANEQTFFAAGNWRNLPADSLGIETLRKKLSNLLFRHLKKELPKLKQELETEYYVTEGDLAVLGSKRETVEERRSYLMQVAIDAQELLKSAVRGNYDHDFFHTYNLKESMLSGTNIRRLRAAIQFMNTEFAHEMARNGQKYSFPNSTAMVDQDDHDTEGELGSPDEPGSPDDNSSPDDSSSPDSEPLSEESNYPHVPKQITRKEAIEWAAETVRRSRGLELPSVFNHQVISQLFWQQSYKWDSIARDHIERVFDICQNFVHQVLSIVAASEVKSRLFDLFIDSALKNTYKSALNELSSIIKDKKRQPMTYNHYFTDTLQKIQRGKLQHDMEQIVNSSQQPVSLRPGVLANYINPDTIAEKMKSRVEQDMESFSAGQALDIQSAYYKDERKYFVNVIAKQVIERHLISGLLDLVSPNSVANLTLEELNDLVAEPEEVVAHRIRLETRMTALEAGREAFQKALRS